MPELDDTTLRRILVIDAAENHQEGAEQIYRCVAALRDHLPPDAQKCLAAIMEWAREGLTHQNETNRTPELESMHAAVTYARDVLVETARKAESG